MCAIPLLVALFRIIIIKIQVGLLNVVAPLRLYFYGVTHNLGKWHYQHLYIDSSTL